MKANYSLPPDEIFKFRGNRQNPSEAIAQEENPYFLTTDIAYCDGNNIMLREYRDNGAKSSFVPKYEKGIFCYYEGVPYPYKGHVFPEAMYAVGQVKRFLMTGVKLCASRDMILPIVGLLVSNKKKTVQRIVDAFIDTVDLNILKPYYLKDEFYSVATLEVRTFIREFLVSLGITKSSADLFGEIISLTFQYDNAYYYRLIDIMSESSKEKILKDSPKELKRLLSIINERDYNIHQQDKYNRLAKMMLIIYFIPSIKKAIKAGFEAVNFEKWQMDEADKYHTMLYDGYKIRGLSFLKRYREYIKYHGAKIEKEIVLKMDGLSDQELNSAIECMFDTKDEMESRKNDIIYSVSNGEMVVILISGLEKLPPRYRYMMGEEGEMILVKITK